ncbi:hypothetical protein XENOCAPTIV_010097 [Xenoophorus captivus]|uniref:Uncharacterized protein n=1 Tax=Xenoophorus captivus TaxID=1517983 RepID=A0ABV0QZP2_9TELE
MIAGIYKCRGYLQEVIYSRNEQCGSGEDEGPAIALLLALRVSQSATKRAAQLLYSLVQWVRGYVRDGWIVGKYKVLQENLIIIFMKFVDRRKHERLSNSSVFFP